MQGAAFLDTSVLLRHFLQDHPDHSPRSTAYVRSIERGERAVGITDTVIFETVFVLTKTYQVPRAAIRAGVLEFLALPGVVCPGKRIYADMFALFVAQPSLSFADCFHAVSASQEYSGAIVSFDRGFDRVPGLTRQEP